MSKIKVYELSFNGNMKRVTKTVEDFPEEILKVDDWFGPQVGELCFNHEGKLDIVKSLKWTDTNGGLFKPHMIASFEISQENVSYSGIQRVEVKKGKVFILNGKPFVHQAPLCGSYIEKMASGKKIVDYEYEFGK